MAELMRFPEDVNDFMEDYKIVDTEQVYTNGAELVPIFRMKQWFEHEKGREIAVVEQLRAEISYLAEKNRELEGEIHGLRFAVRCNGISGGEVER